MRKNTIVCKSNAIYIVAILFGVVLMLPFVGDKEAIKAEQYISSLSLASLGRNISYFPQFVPRFIPLLVIQVFWGISIYKDFCVACIYIFSRRNFRTRWAIAQLMKLLFRVLIYIVIIVLSALITIMLFANVIIDQYTIGYVIWMVSIIVLYSFDTIMMINLLSFFVESGLAFAITEIINLISIAVYLFSAKLNIEDSQILKMNIFLRLMVEPESNITPHVISLMYFSISAIIIAVIAIVVISKTQFTKSCYEGDF